MAGGTVKKVVSDRGFGFITGEDGKDYFFHRDGLAPSLEFDDIHAGEPVEFDVQPGQRGPRAVNVLRAEDHGGRGKPVDWESPRWREVGPANQRDVERGHRFRNDSSPTEKGAIDRGGSVGHGSKGPAADPHA
jgi:cold shock protein